MKQNESPEDIQIRFALHNVHRAVEDIVRLVKMPEFDLSTPVNHRWDMKRVGRDSFENRKNGSNLLSHQENLIL